jgi:hypothetical protein
VRVTLVVAGALAGAFLGASAANALAPLPVLSGSRLRGPTHLRLIVAGNPPAILDLDRGSVRPVTGVVGRGRNTVWVTPALGGALTQVDCRPSCHRAPRAFVVKADGSVHRVRFNSPVVVAANAAPRWALAAVAGDRVALVDRVGNTRRTMRRPSILGGLGGALAEPHGPYVVIAFADPAYPGPQQAEDLFLFNRRTHTLTHVPGFPAQIDLKFSSVAWTSDGRLVLLIQAAGTTSVGIYRPGARTVALREVHLPVRDGGSPSFVPSRVA